LRQTATLWTAQRICWQGQIDVFAQQGSQVRKVPVDRDRLLSLEGCEGGQVWDFDRQAERFEASGTLTGDRRGKGSRDQKPVGLMLDVQFIPERLIDPDEFIPKLRPVGHGGKLPLQVGRLLGEQTQVHEYWHAQSIRPAPDLRNGPPA
jgi:hypothetical protein